MSNDKKPCEACGGSGRAWTGDRNHDCIYCKGTGTVEPVVEDSLTDVPTNEHLELFCLPDPLRSCRPYGRRAEVFAEALLASRVEVERGHRVYEGINRTLLLRDKQLDAADAMREWVKRIPCRPEGPLATIANIGEYMDRLKEWKSLGAKSVATYDATRKEAKDAKRV